MVWGSFVFEACNVSEAESDVFSYATHILFSFQGRPESPQEALVSVLKANIMLNCIMLAQSGAILRKQVVCYWKTSG